MSRDILLQEAGLSIISIQQLQELFIIAFSSPSPLLFD